MDDEGSKRWTQKLLLIGPQVLGLCHSSTCRKKRNILKSRQIDHCPKHLHLVVCAKLLMGFWSLFAINRKIFYVWKNCIIFLDTFLRSDFFPLEVFFRSYFFFCYSKKDLWGGESSFESIEFDLDSIQFWCHCSSPPTRCQKPSVLKRSCYYHPKSKYDIAVL